MSNVKSVIKMDNTYKVGPPPTREQCIDRMILSGVHFGKTAQQIDENLRKHGFVLGMNTIKDKMEEATNKLGDLKDV